MPDEARICLVYVYHARAEVTQGLPITSLSPYVDLFCTRGHD